METRKPAPKDAKSGRPKPPTRIQQRNRDAILDAGLEVFSTHGFRGATLDAIAQAAGLSKPNVLYYFASKDAIYQALLARLLENWLDPLRALDPDGDPCAELMGYMHRKLAMSRDYPRESRLFANEILAGAPQIGGVLRGNLRRLVDERAGVIAGWAAAGRIAPVDPHHLIFSIWALTQHYADFAVQVQAVLGEDDSFVGAQAHLDVLFGRLLAPPDRARPATPAHSGGTLSGAGRFDGSKETRMTHHLTLRQIAPVTHDTWRLEFDRPAGFDFTAGQATHLALDRDGWRDEDRPFTMTSQPGDATLEFIIKSYPSHDGVTEQIPTLKPGDKVIADDPAGAITDKGAGVFIAGGAGITPFIPILRNRARDGTLDGSHLIFSNKHERDIILRDEWEAMEGLKTTFTVTDQDDSALPKTFVDKAFLQREVTQMSQPFYICGPGEMIDSVRDALKEMGVDPDDIHTEEGW